MYKSSDHVTLCVVCVSSILVVVANRLPSFRACAPHLHFYFSASASVLETLNVVLSVMNHSVVPQIRKKVFLRSRGPRRVAREIIPSSSVVAYLFVMRRCVLLKALSDKRKQIEAWAQLEHVTVLSLRLRSEAILDKV